MMTPIEAWALSAWSWLLTYLVHSTVLLMIASLIGARLWRRRVPDSLAEVAWKTALVAGVFSATLQHVAPVTPLTVQWSLVPHTVATTSNHTSSIPSRATSHENVAPSLGAHLSDPAALPTDADALITQNLADAGVMPMTEPTTAYHANRAASTEGSGVRRAVWIGLIMCVFMAAGLGWSLLDAWRLRRWSRTAVTDRRVRLLFARVRSTMGVTKTVRLTSSRRVVVPIVFGLHRPEICLPDRAIDEMDDEALSCVLAHELAHVIRRDMVWRWTALLLERMLFIQPLNRTARQRISQLAEYGCDELAARRLGDALPVARCLTTVAGWLQTSSQAHRATAHLAPAVAMAPLPSTLGQRVERLMTPAAAMSRQDAPRQASTLVSIAVTIAASVACIPVVSADSDPIVVSDLSGDTIDATDQPRPDAAMLSRMLADDIASLDAELAALRFTMQSSAVTTDATTLAQVRRLQDEAATLRDALALIAARLEDLEPVTNEPTTNEPTTNPAISGR